MSLNVWKSQTSKKIWIQLKAEQNNPDYPLKYLLKIVFLPPQILVIVNNGKFTETRWVIWVIRLIRKMVRTELSEFTLWGCERQFNNKSV